MIDNDKADLASRSASLLPRTLVWLGSRVLGFIIFNFLFYTLDLYVWKNIDLIDFCICLNLFNGTV